MAKAFCYIRLTLGETESSPVFVQQKERAEAYFRNDLEGYVWAGCVVDAFDTRALRLFKRPMGGKLFRETEPGDEVIFPRSDRAFFDTKDSLSCLRRLAHRDVSVTLLDIPFYGLRERHIEAYAAMSRLLGAESKRRSERCRQSFATRRKLGRAISPQPPFGKKIAGRKGNRHYVPDPKERAVMARIVEMKQSGMSCERITVQFWKEKILRSNGKEWGQEAVRLAYHAALKLREEEQIPSKRCDVCGQTKPLDTNHFHRNAAQKDGYHRVCKACRSRRAKERTRQAAETKRSAKFAEFMRSSRTHSADKTVEELGGPDKFAKEFVAAIHAAEPGSHKQIGMLERALKLAHKQ